MLDDVFGKAGMPYYAETAEGLLFEVPEVETMLHLLRLLDNPQTGYSPAFDFTFADL